MDDENGNVEVTFQMPRFVMSALEDCAVIEGKSATDVLNRAVQVYQHLLMEKQLGKRVALIQDQKKWWGILRVRRTESFDWK